MADKLDKTSKVWKKEEEGENIRGWVSEYKKKKRKMALWFHFYKNTD